MSIHGADPAPPLPLDQRRPIRRITLEGGPRERGRAHGETLREAIRDHMARWELKLQAELGMATEAYLDTLYRVTDFLPAIRRHTPRLLEEVRGISEGSGVPFARTLARQLSDEEPWVRRNIKLGVYEAESCSSIGRNCVGAHGDGPTIIGQNQDGAMWHHGDQLLARHIDPATGFDVVVFGLVGKLSLAGINAHGLGICCNTLGQLDGSTTGLAEDFVVRGFLEQPSLEAGLAFMRGIEHASGQNYTVGAPGSDALNLECSANRIEMWRPWPEADRVFHTNHPVANPDRGQYERIIAGKSAAEIQALFGRTTHHRFATLERHLGAPSTPVTLETMKAAFADVEIRGVVDGSPAGFTLGCLIMEMVAGAPRLHIAPGPPGSTPFEIVEV